jgi:predicted permease
VTVAELWRRLTVLVHRERFKEDLEEEIRLHRELRAAANRAHGLAPDAAVREAHRSIGNRAAIQELSRDAWGARWLDELGQHLRYAVRTARHNPGFALVAVLTLALGIGANTAIFSVVDAVLLRPLPYRAADRLVTIGSSVVEGGTLEAAMALSYPDYQDIGKLTDAVSGIAAYSTERYSLTNRGEPRDVQVTRATSGLFAVLGVAPAVGRAFTPDETHDPVAVISHALWTSNYHGDSSALGLTIALDDKRFTIVGVMPVGFGFPDAATDVWIPIGYAFVDDPGVARVRMYRAFSTVARLAPGASLGTLRSELAFLGNRITESEPSPKQTLKGFNANSLRDQIVGDARQPLLILLGAVVLVLLIACVNAANLLVARANTREREFAVRRAIGAGRGAIVRLLLVESVLLALAAAAAGLVLAGVGLRVLAAQLPHGYVVGIDGAALAFTTLLAVATGLGFGIAPALRASAAGLEQALRVSAGGTAGRQRRRARDFLVVSEVALALVLLVGSALLVRSFIGLNAVDPGFDPQGLLAARIRLTPARYATANRQRAFFDDIARRLQGNPDVSAITVASSPPLAGEVDQVAIDPQAFRADDPDRFLVIARTHAGPDFFSTLRIPVLQGRAFTADDRPGAPPVCIVSRALAHRLWPHTNPIGQHFNGRGGGRTVVGVVGDVRSEALELAAGPAVYFPAAQSLTESQGGRSYREMWLVLRSAHPLHLVFALRQAVRTEDVTQPIAEIATYEQMMQHRYASRTLITALITLFAGLALVLAVIGIAGVTAYAVSQRTRELGIRIALGARAYDVIGLFVSETGVLVGAGLVIGLAAAFGMTRTLRSVLYGVTSGDPVTFAGAALALGVVALASTWVPARRAARVDPVEALRSE